MEENNSLEILKSDNSNEVKYNNHHINNLTKEQLKIVQKMAETYNMPIQIMENLYRFHCSLSEEDQDLYINDYDAFCKKHNLNSINNNNLPNNSEYYSKPDFTVEEIK